MGFRALQRMVAVEAPALEPEKGRPPIRLATRVTFLFFAVALQEATASLRPSRESQVQCVAALRSI